MSQQYPPPAGQNPGPFAGPPAHGAPSPHAGPDAGAYAGPRAGAYAGPPAYLGMPAPAPQSNGLNPWVAGLIGAGVGAVLTVLAMTLLPMLFFGLAMGSGFMDEEGCMGPPSGRVAVAPDGGVSSVVLADALEDDDDFYYEDVTCPDTVSVDTDVTTICRGDDGFEDMRIVVVFEGTSGQFVTADLW